jgi:hypothetical protein
LRVFRGDTQEYDFPVVTTTVRIGRSHENDIVLEDGNKSVSRLHAELRWDGRQYVLIDLESQNGTLVDGDRAAASPVFIGSVISVGPFRLVLLDDDGPASMTAAAMAGGKAARWTAAVAGEPSPPVSTGVPVHYEPNGPVPQARRKARGSAKRHRPSRWWMAGGLVAIVSLSTAAIAVRRLGRVEAAPEPRHPVTEDAGLAAAQVALDDGRWTDALDAVAAWPVESRTRTDRFSPAALAMHLRAAEQLEPIPTDAPVTTPSTGTGARIFDRDTGLRQAAWESAAAFKQRVVDVRGTVERLSTALDVGDVVTAEFLLGELERKAPDHPGYEIFRRRAAATAESARLVQEARAAYEEGLRLVQSGTPADLMRARERLAAAHRVSPGLGESELARVQAQLARLGEAKYREAKNIHANLNSARNPAVSRQRARDAYREALQLLPIDHPKRLECEQYQRDLQ